MAGTLRAGGGGGKRSTRRTRAGGAGTGRAIRRLESKSHACPWPLVGFRTSCFTSVAQQHNKMLVSHGRSPKVFRFGCIKPHSDAGRSRRCWAHNPISKTIRVWFQPHSYQLGPSPYSLSNEDTEWLGRVTFPLLSRAEATKSEFCLFFASPPVFLSHAADGGMETYQRCPVLLVAVPQFPLYLCESLH